MGGEDYENMECVNPNGKRSVFVSVSLSVMSHQLSPAFLDLSNRLVLNEASSQLHCRCALDTNRYFEGSKEAFGHIEWI